MIEPQSRPSVLLVEDEVGLLEILEVNFRSAGYRVVTATDGVTAACVG